MLTNWNWFWTTKKNCGCTRSAINLAYKILKENQKKSQMFTPYSLQIWFVRIACLMKLKLFKEVEIELSQFDSFCKPQYFYEFQESKYPDRKGCMVPFGLRMLNAELPHFLGRSEESISNLYMVLASVDSVLDSYINDQCNSLHVR